MESHSYKICQPLLLPIFIILLSGCSHNSNSAKVTVLSLAENSSELSYSAKSTMGAKFSLSGLDAHLFSIDNKSGALSINAPLDFEAPQDSNADNIYTFQIDVSRGSRTTVLETVNLAISDTFSMQQPELSYYPASRSLELTGIATTDGSSNFAGYRVSYNYGGSGFSPLDTNQDTQITPDDLLPSTGGSVELPTQILDYPDLNARLYLVEAIDRDGNVIASEQISVANLNSSDLIQYLKANNTDTLDRFGNSVALSGDGRTLAVGAFYEGSDATGIDQDGSNNNAAIAGAVYVYSHDGTIWQGPAYIKSSNTGSDDQFGYSVALNEDGSTLVIGAPNEDGTGTGINPADNGATTPNSGAVYVYHYNGTDWETPTYIKAHKNSNGQFNFFGFSLGLSGDGSTLAVGAYWEHHDGTGIEPAGPYNYNAKYSGAVYVYRHNGTTWEPTPTYIKASNAEGGATVGDEFGYSLALSTDGSTLAVGAIKEDGNGTDQSNNDAVDSGAVYVYRYNGSVWQPPAYIKASNIGAGDNFGSSVALNADGSKLAVGALLEEGDGQGINPPTNNNAPAAVVPPSTINKGAGAVYVYNRNGSDWGTPDYIKASNTDARDSFGYSIAFDAAGTTLVVGAIEEDGDGKGIGPEDSNAAPTAGAVYAYKHDGSAWQGPTYIKANNTSANDKFGQSVSLNSDGSVLAIGAHQEYGSGTGVNPEDDNTATAAGAVYVYE